MPGESSTTPTQKCSPEEHCHKQQSANPYHGGTEHRPGKILRQKHPQRRCPSQWQSGHEVPAKHGHNAECKHRTFEKKVIRTTLISSGETSGTRHHSGLLPRLALTRCFAILLLLATTSACTTHPPRSRSEILATAQAYADLTWTPTKQHLHRGPDPTGLAVTTPDHEYQPPNQLGGWWRPGQTNRGMPYKWGGFDTPTSFQQGLDAGKAAGDVFTPEKRQLLHRAVSDHAVGVDCSGFVSRCWGLPRHYSTRELAQVAQPIRNPEVNLRPGDILNRHNDHVMLFARYLPEGRMLVFEAGSEHVWKVTRSELELAEMLRRGYQPLRYRWVLEN